MKFTIGKKIFIGYAVIIIFGLFLSVFTFKSLSELDKKNNHLNKSLEARRTALKLDIDVLRLIVNLQYFIDTKDSSHLDEIYRNRIASDEARAHLRQTSNLPEVHETLDKYEKILPQRRELADSIITLVQNDVSGNTISSLQEQRRILDEEARSYLRMIIDLEEQDSTTVLAAYNKSLDDLMRNILITFVLFMIAMVIYGILLSKSITKPLRSLGRLTKQIGQGDFSPGHTIKGQDEISDLEKSINEMSQSLAKLDQSKSEFISLVSHQLRTPATVVKQSLGLIIEGYVDDKDKTTALLQNAYDSNEQELNIIDDILNVAKVDAGKLELKKEQFDIAALVEGSVHQMQDAAKEKRHTLKLNNVDKPLLIYADKLKVTMMVENLISNAIKYTPDEGSIEVVLSDEGNNVRIQIKDNGIGIGKEDQKKLFTKFGRIPSDYSVKVQGTGLGLYLVKQFVDMHNGTLEVSSILNEGTTFIINLPKE